MPQKGRVKFDTETEHPELADIVDIEATELQSKASTVNIIDVRGEDEFEGELGHVAGSRLIPLPEFPMRIGELPKDETIVFVCRSGGRSARAAAMALQFGLKNVFNMKGGMLRWNELRLPVEK